MLLKKQYGFRLHLPPIYSNKNMLLEFRFLHAFLYNPQHPKYFRKIQLNLSEKSYFQHTEIVLRGLLTTSKFYQELASWIYFKVHTPKGQELSQALLDLKSDFSCFNQLIRHQPNRFFNHIPLHALHQFFPHMNLDQIKATLSPHGHFTNINQQNQSSLLSSIIQNHSLLQKLKEASCFYLEDLAAQYPRFSTQLNRINKDELIHLLTALLSLLHQKSTFRPVRSNKQVPLI